MSTKRRSKKRGAAMVEGIVVMGVMLVFFGMNTWVYKSYGGKIDQMNSTRRDALYYASHSCEKALREDNDRYTVEGLRGNNASGGSTFNLVGIVKALLGKGDFDFYGTATSQKGTFAVLGTAMTKVGSDGVVHTPLQANLKTTSTVSCNEKRMGNGVMALLAQGWSFIKDLF